MQAETEELKEVTLVFREQAGRRLAVECSVSFDSMSERVKNGETLAGAEAMAYFALRHIIEQAKAATPAPKKSDIITRAKPTLVTEKPKILI